MNYNEYILAACVALGAITDFVRSLKFGDRKNGFVWEDEWYNVFSTIVAGFILVVSADGLSEIKTFGNSTIGDHIYIWGFILGGSSSYAIDVMFLIGKYLVNKAKSWIKKP